MVKQQERIEPAAFEAPASGATPAQEAARSPWLVPLVILLALAGLVVFWLPGRVSTGDPEATAARPPAQAAERDRSDAADPRAAAQPRAAGGDSSGTGAAPYAQALAAKQRREAQEILSELLELQDSLAGRAVEAWAPDAYGAVLQAAQRGDELYRERDFEAATASYETARAEAQQLLDRLPDAIDEWVARLEEALEALAGEQAPQLLEQLEAMAPDDERTETLAERVAALPAVAEALLAAGQAEETGDYEEAVGAARAAVEADPRHGRAGDALARLEALWTQQRFAEAMSEGYRALDERDFTTARGAFERAADLDGGAPEPTAALAELAVAETAARLRSLEREAQALEAEERWEEAVTRYEAAQAIDDGVLFARKGLERARPRARLDRELQEILDQPGRLTEEAVAAATADLLREARGVAGAGERLQRQLQSVEDLLERANTPVTVTLRSDDETVVRVNRVARLGTFEERSLTLRPGEYVAVGTRPGYRDVRRSFEVTPGGTEPVYIACTEPI